MTSVKSLFLEFEKFASDDKQEFLSMIEIILTRTTTIGFTQEVRESRFSDGKSCPHCNEHNVVRNGKYNGKQRYLCKSCKKSFSDFTYSPIYSSKKPIDKWLKYAECMILGYSIRKCAEILEINIATSFYWRHKILGALKSFIGVGSVEGVIEADETFFAESFKGNHKHSKTFQMPRESRKRGKEVRVRGISRDQVCVATAIDRHGNIIIELLCKGRMTNKDLKRLYNERLESKSILCTDSHKSYIQFTKDLNLEHKRIKRGYHKEGLYHIQHINSLHSKLKRWIRTFNGVSTKYLSNYMYWFKWLTYFNNEKESIKSKNFLIHSTSHFVKLNISNFKTLKPAYI